MTVEAFERLRTIRSRVDTDGRVKVADLALTFEVSEIRRRHRRLTTPPLRAAMITAATVHNDRGAANEIGVRTGKPPNSGLQGFP